jgi:serine/threonine protein kinase
MLSTKAGESEMTRAITLDDGRLLKILEAREPGTFSRRYIVELDGTQYFMKTFLNGELAHGTDTRSVLKNEVSLGEILKKELSSNKYKECIEVNDQLCVFYDLVKDRLEKGNNLWDRLDVKDKFNQPQRKMSPKKLKEWWFDQRSEVMAENYQAFNCDQIIYIAKEISRQLEELHQNGVVHMDLTPQNVMVSWKQIEDKEIMQVDLIDLGIARAKDDEVKYLHNKTLQTTVKTSYYGSSKDGLLNRIYHSKHLSGMKEAMAKPHLDIYNLGNIISLMFTGKLTEAYAMDSERDFSMDLDKFSADLALRVEEKSTANQLVSIITKCIMPPDSAYQEVSTLLKDLEKLPQGDISRDPALVALPLDLPEEIRVYRPSAPDLSSLFSKEVATARTAMDHFANLPMVLPEESLFPGVADRIDTLLNKKALDNTRNQKMKKYLHPLLKGLIGLGLLGGIAYVGINYAPMCNPTKANQQVPIKDSGIVIQPDGSVIRIEPKFVKPIIEQPTIERIPLALAESLDFYCYNNEAGVKADFHFDISGFDKVQRVVLYANKEPVDEWVLTDFIESKQKDFSQVSTKPGEVDYELGLFMEGKEHVSDIQSVKYSGKIDDRAPFSFIQYKAQTNSMHLFSLDVGDHSGFVDVKFYEENDLIEHWDDNISNPFEKAILVSPMPGKNYKLTVKDNAGHVVESPFLLEELNACGNENTIGAFKKPDDWADYACRAKQGGDEHCISRKHYATKDLAEKNNLRYGCEPETICCPPIENN